MTTPEWTADDAAILGAGIPSEQEAPLVGPQLLAAGGPIPAQNWALVGEGPHDEIFTGSAQVIPWSREMLEAWYRREPSLAMLRANGQPGTPKA